MFAQKQFTVLKPTSQRTASTESYVQWGKGKEKKRKMVRKMLTKVKWMMIGNGQSQMFTENRSVSKFFCKKPTHFSQAHQ